MAVFQKGDIIPELSGAAPGLMFQLNDPYEQPSVIALAVNSDISPLFPLGGKYDFAWSVLGDDIAFLSFRPEGAHWCSAPFNPHLTGTPKIGALEEGNGIPCLLVKVNTEGGIVEYSEYIVLGSFFSNLITKDSDRMLDSEFDLTSFLNAKNRAYAEYPTDDAIAKKTQYICTLGTKDLQ